jgi:hypothetical protein
LYKSSRKTTHSNRKVEINFTICIFACDGPKTEQFTVTNNEMRRGGGGGREEEEEEDEEEEEKQEEKEESNRPLAKIS